MRGVEGGEGAIGPIRAEGADRTDVAALYIYCYVIEHHWNRLYDFMGLWSKVSEWMGDGYLKSAEILNQPQF